jgi:hypothetical protein
VLEDRAVQRHRNQVLRAVGLEGNRLCALDNDILESTQGRNCSGR